jgi:enolase-phosphatase E1
LTPYLAAHFDTTTGPKKEPGSYQRIAAALGGAPAQVLFLSDSVAELDAARAAGMETALSARPENPEPEPHEHRVIRTFDEVFS